MRKLRCLHPALVACICLLLGASIFLYRTRTSGNPAPASHFLLGAPTSLCWRNAVWLDDHFPEGTGVAWARPVRGQAAPVHMCTVTNGPQTPVEQLLQHAVAVTPCNMTQPCRPSQLYSLRHAVHAAAHATLRYYIPADAPRHQHMHRLQQLMAFNPLVCGQQVLAAEPQHGQPPPWHLLPMPSTACQLLPSMLQLMGAVAAHGEAVDCRWDPSLPDLPGKLPFPMHPPIRQHLFARIQKPLAPVEPHGKPANYLVAFALSNAQKVLPHFILQVLALVTYLPPGHVLVSCYESGSGDDTPKWLHLLQGLLDLLHIPNHIVIQGDLKRGDMGRVEFLAHVRNAVLAPLYDPAVHTAAWQRSHHTARHQSMEGVFPADKIIFINDPFFSWQDLIRLAHHDADLVCGLDFQALNANLLPDTRRSLVDAADIYGSMLLQGLPEQPAGIDGGAEDHKPSNLLSGTTRKLMQQGHPAFYDTWVARDMAGKRFYWLMPMVHDEEGRRLLAQGLPLPVQCCWNAAVVMNAAPFKPGAMPPPGHTGATDRLQFRSAAQGECPASECSLLCNDLWRLGYRRVLVDPSVRMSYLPYNFTYLHGTVLGGLPALTWSQVQTKTRQQQVNSTQLMRAAAIPQAVECCPLQPGRDYVFFQECFMDHHWLDQPGSYDVYNQSFNSSAHHSS